MGKRQKNAGNASHKEVKERQGQIDHGPIFFFMPKEKYGEFCQWYPCKFTVTKDDISTLIGRDDHYMCNPQPPLDYSDISAASSQPSQPLHPNSPLGTDSVEGIEGKGKGNEVAIDATPLFLFSFNCAEQFMMYCKAARFGDIATQRRILLSGDPKEQKQLAKETIGFLDASWDEIKFPVVVAGNMAKFKQSRELRMVLLDTMCKDTGWRGDGRGEEWVGRELIEAASRDPVWGIGFTAANARKTPREKWGQNLLGKALMEVRRRLMDETPEGAMMKERWKEGRESMRTSREQEQKNERIAAGLTHPWTRGQGWC